MNNLKILELFGGIGAPRKGLENLGYDIISTSVMEELKRHNEWKETNKLSATPTILVNGYVLPEHYQIEDMVEFVDSTINN